MEATIVPSSFRDPSGFVFWKDAVLYRQIKDSYGKHYDRLMESGLYDRLVEKKLLVDHEEVPPSTAVPTPGAYRIIRPRLIDFISYPYEWCFSQLKAAALATLQIQKDAIDSGLTLKDASAFNIQFLKNDPILIDTLSFEVYEEDRPWLAYKQFCQHFLAPLALMAYRDVRLLELSKTFIDGIPLDLTSRLLPRRSYLSLGACLHIHLHARGQKSYADREVSRAKHRVRKSGLLGIIDSLESTVRKLRWRSAGTEWAEYYSATNYSDSATEKKKEVVGEFVRKLQPKRVWDLGANTGVFSRVAAETGARVVSFDIDPAAVERNYLTCQESGTTSVLPLLLDLTNPSPAIGWANEERNALIERGPTDLILALALVHHSAISNNTPLAKIAGLFQRMGNHLVIEFVPKEDSQVKKLLATRDDVFPDYHQTAFEQVFSECFVIVHKEKVGDSLRTLYLMRNRNPHPDRR